MAYRKRYGSRRRRFSGRRRSPRLFKRTRKIVKRVINRMAEIKWDSIRSSATLVGAATAPFAFSVINIIPTISLGTTRRDRIGSKIQTQRLTFNWAARAVIPTVDTYTPYTGHWAAGIRIMLVQTYSGALPGAGEIFDTAGGGAVSGDYFITPIQTSNVRVLKQWKVRLSTDNAKYGIPANVFGGCSLRFKRNMKWDDASNLQNNETNVFVVVSSGLTLATNSIDFVGYTRMSFTDL